MIINLTENRFLQLVQKIELINWDWFRIHYVAQRKSPSNNVQSWQYIILRLSFIFEFLIVFFCFQFYFGRSFHGFSSLNTGSEDFSPKKGFSIVRQILGANFLGNCSTFVLMIRSCQGIGVSQKAFSSNLNNENLNFFSGHGGRPEGLPGGTGGRRKLCMVPCHSYYIWGTKRST